MRRPLVLVVIAACGGAPSETPDATPPPIDGATQVMTFVYAHTSTALYRIDPDALSITRVGAFAFAGAAQPITDIAINRSGTLLGISRDSVYVIDPSTAEARQLSTGLTGGFNGLTFVPSTLFGQVGDDVLIAMRNLDGAVFRIDPTTGASRQVGDTGGPRSSGDVVSVAGFGTMMTAENGTAPDRLVRLAPQSFAATEIGVVETGLGDIRGLAYWKGRMFGFTHTGEFLVIDPTDAATIVVQRDGPSWWGAAVITTAPVLF